MATKKQQQLQIEFNAKNVKAFTNWLKKFSSIDNSLLLEIDDSQFIAKSYNEERSCVKMSCIKFDDAGLTLNSAKASKRVKVGIYNISRLIKVIEQFSDAEFLLGINYQELINEDTTTQFAGESILLSNKKLKMNMDCTSLNIFKYISDDLFKNSIASIEPIGTFNLSKINIDKINSLCALDDSDHKFIEFKFKNGKVLAAGKIFEYEIEEKSVNDTTLNIFKEQYSNVDVENYEVSLGEDRLVFKSSDSDTTCVISQAIDKD